MTKVRQDKDVADRIGTLYVDNEIELSRPIRQGMVYDEDIIGQQCD